MSALIINPRVKHIVLSVVDDGDSANRYAFTNTRTIAFGTTRKVITKDDLPNAVAYILRSGFTSDGVPTRN